MRTAPSPTTSVLKELLGWSVFARSMLSASLRPSQSPTVRIRKHGLIRQHARHVKQLRGWLGRGVAERSVRSNPVGAWNQVTHAMASDDAYVAMAACDLLERALLTAYERALTRPQLDPVALRLLRRQLHTLKCARDRARQARPSWFARVKQPAAAVATADDWRGTVAAPA